ncbi:MAG: DUF1566 domain-containing protein [Alphaproteobacteria bacterium]|nr:DUF1566 domain-containing protein [Alphaproteobacteria bacterium]
MTEQFGTAGNTELNVGDKMADGSIFAGISPETKRPMFVLPKDESLTMSFNEAQKYSRTVDAGGHKDWRLPTPSELNVFYQNKDKGFLKGTFNDNAWYLASPQFHGYNDEPHEQRFSDGLRDWNLMGGYSSIRFVRS